MSKCEAYPDCQCCNPNYPAQPTCPKCHGAGIIGRAPDDYWHCDECNKPAPQPERYGVDDGTRYTMASDGRLYPSHLTELERGEPTAPSEKDERDRQSLEYRNGRDMLLSVDAAKLQGFLRGWDAAIAWERKNRK